MIDTTDGKGASALSKDGAAVDLGQIDEIIEESKSYSQAVSDSQRPGQGHRLQAEPSRFYMAAQMQDRKNNSASAAATKKDSNDGGQEEEKQENWVVTDKMPMVNFK